MSPLPAFGCGSRVGPPTHAWSLPPGARPRRGQRIQPRATPWEPKVPQPKALKGRKNGRVPCHNPSPRTSLRLIFSTKNREPLLTPAIRPALHSYLGGILSQWDNRAGLRSLVPFQGVIGLVSRVPRALPCAGFLQPFRLLSGVDRPFLPSALHYEWR